MLGDVATAARAGPRPLVACSVPLAPLAPLRRGPRLGWAAGAVVAALLALAAVVARAVPVVAEAPAADAAADAAAAAVRELEVAISRSVVPTLVRSGRRAGAAP